MKAEPVTYKAGSTVVREGEPGQEMFVVESGSLEVFRGSGTRERKIAVLGAGDFFGESVLLEEKPHAVSVRTVVESRLLALDGATLDHMLRQHPDAAVRMLRVSAARLRAESVRADEAESSAPASPPAPRTAVPAPPSGSQVPMKGSASKSSRPSSSAAGARSRSLVPPGAGSVPIALPDKDDVRLGRFDSVSGQTPDVELGPLDTKHLTSRRHARLVREGGETFVLEDVATANGTFVNGTRVQAGVKARVRDGDTLRFGGVDLVYRGD